MKLQPSGHLESTEHDSPVETRGPRKSMNLYVTCSLIDFERQQRRGEGGRGDVKWKQTNFHFVSWLDMCSARDLYVYIHE